MSPNAIDLARQGIAQLLTDVRVMDEEMREVPQDGKTVGEIVARGNNVMEGYFKQPEETAKAMRGGWFHTGDLGWYTPTAISRSSIAPRM